MSPDRQRKFFDDQKELFLPGLEEYALRHTSLPSEQLLDIERDTQAFGRRSVMLSGQIVGKLLAILTAVLQPALAVDIGTFTGYSALSIAERLPATGKVITCEHDPEMASLAQRYFDKSPFRDQIELRLGPALETLQTLSRPIDLAFIDGDKPEYWEYYEAVLARLAPRGLIVIDNTLLLGGVLLNDSETDKLSEIFQRYRKSIVDFNRRLQQDPRTENCLLSVRDGVTLVARCPLPRGIA